MVPYPLRRHAQLFTYRDEQRVSSLCLSRVNLNSPPYTALYISLYALTYIYICISHYSNGFSAFFYWDTLKIRRIMHAYINKNIHGVFRLFLSIIPSPPSWSFRSHRQLEDLVHFPLSYSSAPNPSNTRGQPLLMFILKTPGCSNSPLAVSCKRTAFQLAICPSLPYFNSLFCMELLLSKHILSNNTAQLRIEICTHMPTRFSLQFSMSHSETFLIAVIFFRWTPADSSAFGFVLAVYELMLHLQIPHTAQSSNYSTYLLFVSVNLCSVVTYTFLWHPRHYNKQPEFFRRRYVTWTVFVSASNCHCRNKSGISPPFFSTAFPCAALRKKIAAKPASTSRIVPVRQPTKKRYSVAVYLTGCLL